MRRIAAILLTTATLLATGVATATEEARGLSRAPATAGTATPFIAGTYRALLIGNDAYADPRGMWKPLKTAVADAQAVANVLRTDYGFADVQVITNATQSDILKALDELSKRSDANDSLFIYYAGHGYMDAEKNLGYWVPIDAKGVESSSLLRNSTIKDEIEVIVKRVKHTLLISDSCFSGSLLSGRDRGPTESERTNGYYERVSQKKSAQVLTSGGKEFVDDNYRSSGHSPFTHFLLNELKTNNQSLFTATELATQVEKGVANNVRQTPESGVLQGVGHEQGEFIFAKLGADHSGQFAPIRTSSGSGTDPRTGKPDPSLFTDSPLQIPFM